MGFRGGGCTFGGAFGFGDQAGGFSRCHVFKEWKNWNIMNKNNCWKAEIIYCTSLSRGKGASSGKKCVIVYS